MVKIYQKDAKRLTGEHGLPIVRLAEHDRVESIDVAMDLDDRKAAIAAQTGQLRQAELSVYRGFSWKRAFDQLVIIGGEHGREAHLRQQPVRRSGLKGAIPKDVVKKLSEAALAQPFPKLLRGEKKFVVPDQLPDSSGIKNYGFLRCPLER